MHNGGKKGPVARTALLLVWLWASASLSLPLADAQQAPTEETVAADSVQSATPPVPEPPLSDSTAEPVATAPAVSSAAEEVEPEQAYPFFEARARVITGLHWQRSHPRPEQLELDSRQPFFLKQARLKLTTELNKWVKLSVSADLEGKPPIRSAYLQVRLKRYLQFRVGRFKRPMSRLELTSIGSLPFIDRGLFNAALIERAGWGDRALGLMARGKLKKLKLRYYLAGMNSAPSIDTSRLSQLRGADLLARVQWSPLKAFSVGVNGGHKVSEARIDGPNLHMNAIGADVRLRLGPLEWNLELLAAQNPYPPALTATVTGSSAVRTPWAITAISYATLDLALSTDLSLQPTAFFEWLDTDLDYSRDEALRGVLGCNLVAFESLRLMPFFEIVRPVGAASGRSQVAYEQYALALSLQI